MFDEIPLNMLMRITFCSIGNELLKDLFRNKMFVKNFKAFFSVSLLFEIDIAEFRFFNGVFYQDLCFRQFGGEFCHS